MMRAYVAGVVIDAAAAALERADWETAKRLYAESLQREETPEALEGLASAIFFLNETEELLTARERAFALYREAGRPVDAARVAISLAWDYRSLRGEKAIGDGWLARARRLLDGREPTRELGWLALREASFALPGDVPRALARCAEAEELGRRLGDVDIEMTALALGGLARVDEGRVADGMAQLDEATTAATAGEMRDPVAIGFSCCYLIFACERVRDFERAGQWCQRVAQMAEGWNIQALRAVCRAHYGTVLMLRGDWAEADAVLTEAVAAFPDGARESTDALARLAELRRRQGRTDDALALIARSEHHPIAALTAASLALERGDTAAAADAATRYLRLIEGSKTERSPGLEVLAEAHAAAGRSDDASRAAAELRTIAQAAGTDPLLAAARQADGHAAAGGDDAREAFEDAVQLFARAGLPFESARARVALAGVLRDLGRGDAASRELELARGQFAGLGAAAHERRTAPGLTERESEILGLVAAGLSNKQIAARLTLSEHTVHRHVANILVKLHVSSRAAAATYAAKHGLA
jgi:DNA-binding NarL/FixJ family response regulator